jgi:arginine/ornithine N-succinyltransferase beta subunit
VLFKGGTTLYYVNNIMGRADLGSLLLTTTLASGVLGAMLSRLSLKILIK